VTRTALTATVRPWELCAVSQYAQSVLPSAVTTNVHWVTRL
jgi:hypothetical protein